MVASDTLVGVIGAVILLVALGGVFVFESRDTSISRDFAVAETAVVAKEPSTITVTPPQNPVVPGGPCAPSAGSPSSNCLPGSLKLTLTLSLPAVDAASNGVYVAFVTGSGVTPASFGKLTADAAGFKVDQTKTPFNPSGYNMVVVSYETSESAAAPSTVHVFEKSFTGTGAVDLKGTYNAKVTAGGTGMITLRDTDAGVQVDVTTSGLSNHTGYQYRVWLHTEGRDNGYTYVGTLTAGNTTLSGSAGGKASDYNHAMVTVEPKGFMPAKTAAATGGPTALSLALKTPPSPVVR